MRVLIPLVISASLFAADPKLTPEMQVVVDHISANSLRGHLSFIASDLLQGRATPSPGLDLAAEYIAAQFRRAGLEPAGDDGYFQTATLRIREPNWQGFHMRLAAGSKAIELTRDDVYISTASALDFQDVRIVVADTYTTAESVKGKVVFAPNPRIAGRFRGSEAALVLLPADDRGPDLPPGPQVSDPETSRRSVPVATIARADATDLLAHAKDVLLKLHMEGPIEQSAKVRNVAGLLRGSDPVLRDTYVMLTAHYDHLGTRGSGPDRIFNGANDDGSGTVSVMEIAGAMAALDPRPKRSILFLTFFGEERGLLGSRWALVTMGAILWCHSRKRLQILIWNRSAVLTHPMDLRSEPRRLPDSIFRTYRESWLKRVDWSALTSTKIIKRATHFSAEATIKRSPTWVYQPTLYASPSTIAIITRSVMNGRKSILPTWPKSTMRSGWPSWTSPLMLPHLSGTAPYQRPKNTWKPRGSCTPSSRWGARVKQAPQWPIRHRC
jgi:hypothetical protein